MAKTINFEFEGVQYNLEYTRKSIETMERKGFKISDLEDKPVTTFPAMFAGAFLAHHKFVKPEIIDKIFNSLRNKDALVGKLAEMYNETILVMMDDPEESEGNLDWGTSW